MDGAQVEFIYGTQTTKVAAAVGATAITMPETAWDGSGDFMLASIPTMGGTILTFSMGQLDLNISSSSGAPGDPGASTVFVYTINQFGQVGKWSRYTFPFAIDAFAQLDDDLYIRSGDDLLRVDDAAWQDRQLPDGTGVPIPGTVQWPWLEFGQPGVSKQLVGFDLVGSGAPSMSIGYDQSNDAAFTPPFAVPPDTVPGMVIPLPVMAPSMSLRITYTRDAATRTWQLQAANLYLQDQRLTA